MRRIENMPLEARRAVIAERRQELKNAQAYFGPKYTIKLHPLLHIDGPEFPYEVLMPATHDKKLRQVVEDIGGCFHRETGMGDGIPYSAASHFTLGQHRHEVVLFNSRRMLATFPVAAGAAHMTKEDGLWWLDWIWIHPYERGSAHRTYGDSLMELAWIDLETAYTNTFKIQTPVTAAMRAFLTKRKVDPSRWGHTNR